MKWVEESHAKDLHGKLIEHFNAENYRPDLSCEGSGVHWRCVDSLYDRHCRVHCFDVKGPEYLCEFEAHNEVTAMGRTTSKTDVVAAISDWLQRSSPEQMHERFAFVDENKRRLIGIADSVVTYFPELKLKAQHELRHIVSDIHELWFTHRDRGCKISYHGRNAHADATFLWDSCQLFRFLAEDSSKLGLVMKRWLCEYAMPSSLRVEFPWIEIGELATHYEQGQPTEGEFLMSWKSIQGFYTKAEIPAKQQILGLVAEMRKHGYDKLLRAGQSMFSLVLSRSRRHGLHQSQPRLHFSFSSDKMTVHSNLGGEQTYNFPNIALSAEVEGLLQRLAEAQID